MKMVSSVLRCGLLTLCIISGAAADTWKETTFQDFADGTFGDSGANMYVSAKGRIEAVNRWDVNGDGYIDILCVNTHSLVEMLDMSIYWGDGKDFSIRNHSYVPADGPMWVAPGDLNKDGAVDLVLGNYSNGTYTAMDSAVYWGGLKDPSYKAKPGEWAVYPFKGKTLLPAQNTQGVAVADLNNDGFAEVVFAFGEGFWEYRPKDKDKLQGPPYSRIYWNTGGSFDPQKYTDLATKGATGVAAADFNQDGWVDLAFSNSIGDASYVCLNRSGSFPEDFRAELPTVSPHGVETGDVNNDGTTDLVFANESGNVSYAYLNKGGAFDPKDRLEFETYMAKDAVVADFNKDGRNDVFFTNHQQSWRDEKRFGNRVIDSFLYYGSDRGFLPEKRVNLQTIGAWGATAADLNEDGWIDLVVSNFQEAYSYEVPSFVYWNGPAGFDVTKRTPLYEHGAQGNTVADFNGDGHPDILITSMMENSRGDYDPSYLYLGNKDGQYNTRDRIVLTGREPYEQAMADLDNDGDVDILIANQGEISRYENELWIYWNKDNTFDTWRMTGLPGFRPAGVETADLDRDGYIDIVLSSNGNYTLGPDAPVDPGSFIYWGSADGWVVLDRTVLKVSESRGASIADLNGDGHLDLIFAGPEASIFWGDGTRNFGDSRRQKIPGMYGKLSNQTEIADLNKDGFLDIVVAGKALLIYYGDAAFSYDRKVEFPVAPKTMNIADVNSDGWLDLVCPVYSDPKTGKRTLDSYVLLGGPQGFSVDSKLSFPTDGGTGSIVSDFNFDGYPDVFFFCHRKDGSPDEIGQFGDHHTNSRLFWNGSQGFRPDNYLAIPSVGAHYDMGVDIGNIRDRSLTFDYMSSPRDCEGKRPSALRWDAQLPPRTALKFQLRSAATREALRNAAWTGPDGLNSFYTAPGPVKGLKGLPEGAWLQYRAVFDTFNGANSPVLDTVEITFE